ncbi:hypothetical protein LJC20_06750, partial [Eubacteriales bacterium OttesenSCG-928-M02]|nr:hypothetical protein [Eubacteriales bacterium OttesenSCG-928-M02]
PSTEETNPVATPYICRPGEVIEISFTIKNDSDFEFVREFTPNVNGQDLETLTAEFSEGHSEAVLSFEYLCEAEGRYDITLEDIGFPLLCYVADTLPTRTEVLINKIAESSTSTKLKASLTVQNKTGEPMFFFLTNQEGTETMLKGFFPANSERKMEIQGGTYKVYCAFGKHYNRNYGGFVLPGTTYTFENAYTVKSTEDEVQHYTITITGNPLEGKNPANTQAVDPDTIPK